MLIPEFPWSCSFLTTKRLDFSNKHAHLLTASKGCFAHAQEEVCTHWVYLLPIVSVRHLPCPLFSTEHHAVGPPCVSLGTMFSSGFIQLM